MAGMVSVVDVDAYYNNLCEITNLNKDVVMPIVNSTFYQVVIGKISFIDAVIYIEGILPMLGNENIQSNKKHSLVYSM